MTNKLPSGTIQFTGKLRNDKDESGKSGWERVYGMTEEQIKNLLYDDVQGNITYGHGNKDRCKLNIWVRWTGRTPRYVLRMRSEYRRSIKPIHLVKNKWELLNAYTMADTWSGTFGTAPNASDNNEMVPARMFEDYEKFQRYWIDVKFLLGELAGKKYFQVRLDNPEQGNVLPDKRFEIDGINPTTNSSGVTMSGIIDEIQNRFAIEVKAYDYYKDDLVELWQELVVANGNLSQKQINSFKKDYRKGDD